MTSERDVVSRRGFLRGAAGAAATTGAAGTASAQEDGTDSGGGTEEVVVGPEGDFVYDPETLEIIPGTTVNWVWDSDNHNIVVETQPDDATWEGTEGGSGDLYNTGHEYSHTFETLGTYEYFCAPHKSAGMIATVEVVESISTPAEGAAVPSVPDAAKTLGVATLFAMIATLGFAFFFMKYGGEVEADAGE